MEHPYRSLKIKEWAAEDRPREKLMSKGTHSLSDAELLAILIREGNRNESALELARKILGKAGNNLNELGKLSVNELTEMKGIGPAKAITLLAALELGRRRKFSEVMTRFKITSSRDAFELFQPILGDISHEEFWILLLNRSNGIIDKQRVSQGGLAGTVMDIRLILKCAIEKLATGIILCHNHPSGNVAPSDADKEITIKMKQSAEIMDIFLLDHIIISDDNWFSFADEGMIGNTRVK
ncbi:MAG: DNA repair protein RadC [Bacteroidetes bacterium]|nr:DNA repair protein RadC [Bacteroidota bacterium]